MVTVAEAGVLAHEFCRALGLLEEERDPAT
jgi:hypothetical protein